MHCWLAASWFGRSAHLYQLNCNPCGRPLPPSPIPLIAGPLIKLAVESIDGQYLGIGSVWSMAGFVGAA